MLSSKLKVALAALNEQHPLAELVTRYQPLVQHGEFDAGICRFELPAAGFGPRILAVIVVIHYSPHLAGGGEGLF